jgi:hypothetical protein
MKHSKLRKYQLPDFLSTTTTTTLTQTSYERWLRGRAAAHVKRDKKRGNTAATNEAYKIAIHRAVIHSAGKDYYTGEGLDWSLVCKYSNALLSGYVSNKFNWLYGDASSLSSSTS